jgi:hypothetical protein
VSGSAACTGCGGPLSAGQRFCRRCGTAVAAPAEAAPPTPGSSTGCPQCGHALVPNARFCRGCGAALTPDAADARPSRELASPDEALSPATDPERFRATMPEVGMPELGPQPPAAPRPGRGRAGAPRPGSVTRGDEPATPWTPLAPPRGGARSSPDPSPGAAPSSARQSRVRRLTAVLVVGALVVAGGVLAGRALSGKGATPDTPLPSISRDAMTRQIRTMFRDYHQSLAHGRLDHAFSLMSERKRQDVLDDDLLDEWKQDGASFGKQIEPSRLQVKIVATDAKAGIAAVRISGMPYHDPASLCKTWSGVTWVKYEHGAFHYDPGYSTTTAREAEWKPRALETFGFAASRRPSPDDVARVRSACGS